MIEHITDTADNIVHLRVAGEVNLDEYKKVLIPAVDKALEKADKVHCLIEIAEDTRFTVAAMMEDTIYGFANLWRWGRVAVVSDADWITRAVNLFALVSPIPLKTFAAADVAAARAWLAEAAEKAA